MPAMSSGKEEGDAQQRSLRGRLEGNQVPWKPSGKGVSRSRGPPTTTSPADRPRLSRHHWVWWDAGQAGASTQRASEGREICSECIQEKTRMWKRELGSHNSSEGFCYKENRGTGRWLSYAFLNASLSFLEFLIVFLFLVLSLPLLPPLL